MEVLSFRKEIIERGITRICHFTRSQKALHILSTEDGLKAVDFLDKSLYDANDLQRLDGRKDFINCSIQYPNHWYLKKVMNNDPIFNEWVILLIKPEIMLASTTEFCPFNAATGCGSHISKGYYAFQKLYDNQIKGRCRTSSMLSCCPTDDQAEVLIYKNISRKDIMGVIVLNENQAENESIRWYENLKSVPHFDIFIAPDLFNGSWSKLVRNGIKPEEILYKGSV